MEASPDPAIPDFDLGADVRPLALLVNPSSGGGRAAKLLPRAEAALDARRVPFRVVRTRSLEHGVAKRSKRWRRASFRW